MSSSAPYDFVVVGAGISGMTAALLLAEDPSKRILLLEKANQIGGSLSRFSLEGIPFETGFHFTGGLSQGGLLADMLKVLNLHKKIEPLPLAKKGSHFVFEKSKKQFSFSNTRAELEQELCTFFPEEKTALLDYFNQIDAICNATSSMDLKRLAESSGFLDEDFEPLSTVLNQLFKSPELKAILAGYALCYGVSPNEISFANHARMVQGMYNGSVRVKEGGDAFIAAFRSALEKENIEIRCSTSIISCEQTEKNRIDAFRLANGEIIAFKEALFTIHPKLILDLLPPESLRKAFTNRVRAFESSSGFFAIFAVCTDPTLLDDSIFLEFPDTALDSLLLPKNRDDDAMLFFISGMENKIRTLTILEAADPDHFNDWSDSTIKHRPAEYVAYKKRETERILERLFIQHPQLKGNIRVLESSTPLTFRDYLNSPDGSAYGIKQKIGQFNLLGRLPIRNLYAAGQSAVLPGIMGAMVSSFMVCRTLLDPQKFDENIKRRLEQ